MTEVRNARRQVGLYRHETLTSLEFCRVMRLPRRIEWRAGIVVIAVGFTIFSLLIWSSIIKIDMSIKTSGILYISGHTRVVTIKVSDQSLSIIRQSRYIKISAPNVERFYGQIIGIKGEFTESEDSLSVEIEFKDVNRDKIAIGNLDGHRVDITLLRKLREPLLKVLLDYQLFGVGSKHKLNM